MSTFVLLTITGLGLGAMYFLIASGLSLIYGLMGVLNFAHGAFLTIGAYAFWYTETKVDGLSIWPQFLIAAVLAVLVTTVFSALVELVMIRPLYGRHIEQVLVTVGLALAITALVTAIWGNDARVIAAPPWLGQTTTVLGAHIPNDRWTEIGTAVLVLFGLEAFLKRTRYGLIIRAGVENRAMVTALGIDVRKAFTLVFAIGGVAVSDAERAQAFAVSMALVAWWVIVPSSVASFVTGVVQSVGTHWGLVRHYWVIIKLLMNALASVLLLAHMGPIDRVAREAALASDDVHHIKVRLIGDAVAAIVMLLVASALSVYKPKGRTRVGEDATPPDDGTHEDDRR